MAVLNFHPVCSSQCTQAPLCNVRSSVDDSPCGKCTACMALACLCLQVTKIVSSERGSFESFSYFHRGVERSSQERELHCQRLNALTLVERLGLTDSQLLSDLVRMESTRDFMVVLCIPSTQLVATPSLEQQAEEDQRREESQLPSGLFLWSPLPRLPVNTAPPTAIHGSTEGLIKSACCLGSCGLSNKHLGPNSGFRLLRCSGQRPDRPVGFASVGHCTARYCTAEHQRMDWEVHQKACGFQSSVI